MLVTLDIKNESMKENFLNFIGTLDYVEIKDNTQINDKYSNKKDKFSKFAGLWDDTVNEKYIKEKAWKR